MKSETIPAARVAVIMPVMISEPWQRHMTECAIKTLRDTTAVPFNLVIVETESSNAGLWLRESSEAIPVTYLQRSAKSTLVKDTNWGIAKAVALGASYIVQTANDIFTRPGWLEALLQCFEIPDCGIATLASSDICKNPAPTIFEGVYGPFMMFKTKTGSRLHYLDEAYESIFSDTDLILRYYKAGFRSYRNWSVMIHHLLRQTWNAAGDAKLKENFEVGKKLFIERHKGCPLWIYKALAEGTVL